MLSGRVDSIGEPTPHGRTINFTNVRLYKVETNAPAPLQAHNSITRFKRDPLAQTKVVFSSNNTFASKASNSVAKLPQGNARRLLRFYVVNNQLLHTFTQRAKAPIYHNGPSAA